MALSFLQAQLRHARTVRPSLGTRISAQLLAHTLARYAELSLRTGAPARRAARAQGAKDTVAVLLLYARPANLEPIAGTLLCCPSVREIVISINHPDLRLSPSPALADPRVRVVRQAERTAPGIRLLLARDAPAPYYALIDDDMFLFPAQIEKILAALRAEPWRAHGMSGEVYDRHPTAARPRIDVRNRDGVADVLNNVYFVSRPNLLLSLELARAAGIGDVAGLRNGEDILLSLAGLDCARVHAVGRYGECISSIVPGIAAWNTIPNFQEERMQLYDRLARVQRRLILSLWDQLPEGCLAER